MQNCNSFRDFIENLDSPEAIRFKEKRKKMCCELGKLMFHYHTTHGLTKQTMIDIIRGTHATI